MGGSKGGEQSDSELQVQHDSREFFLAHRPLNELTRGLSLLHWLTKVDKSSSALEDKIKVDQRLSELKAVKFR